MSKANFHMSKHSHTTLTLFILILMWTISCASPATMNGLESTPSQSTNGIDNEVINEIPNEWDAGPTTTIPIPDNEDKGEISWQSQLIVSTPDSVGLPIIQVMEPVDTDSNPDIANHILVVEQTELTTNTSETADWIKKTSRKIDQGIVSISKSLVKSANALSLDVGLNYQSALCDVANVQCFTLSEKGTLKPHLIDIASVALDPNQYVTPRFKIQLLDPISNTIKSTIEEASLDHVTFTYNLPSNNNGRSFDTINKSMFLANQLGDVSELKISGGRFITSSGEFENQYFKTMIPEYQNFGNVLGFIYDNFSDEFVFMNKLKIFSAPFNQTNQELDAPTNTTRGECSILNFCKPTGMKNYGHGAVNNIFYGTQTWLRASNSGSIRRLYDPNRKGNKPIFFSNTQRDLATDGNPLRHLKTMAFGADSSKQIAAVFMGTGDPIREPDHEDSTNEHPEDSLEAEDNDDEEQNPTSSHSRISFTAMNNDQIDSHSLGQTILESYDIQYYLAISRNLDHEERISRDDLPDDSVELAYSNIIIDLADDMNDGRKVSETTFIAVQNQHDTNDGALVLVTKSNLYFVSYDNLDLNDEKHLRIMKNYTLTFQDIKGFDFNKKLDKIFLLAKVNDELEPRLIEISTKNILEQGPKIISSIDIAKYILPDKKFAVKPYDLKIFHNPHQDKGFVTFFSNTLKSMISIPIKASVEFQNKTSFPTSVEVELLKQTKSVQPNVNFTDNPNLQFQPIDPSKSIVN